MLLSEKRDSNPQPSAWKADALPIELFSRIFFKVLWCCTVLFYSKKSEKRDSNPQPSAWKADALPIELFSQLFFKVLWFCTVLFCSKKSEKRDSNPQPSAWKADALPIELFSHRLLVEWWEQDSNLRRCNQRIYSPPSLAA